MLYVCDKKPDFVPSDWVPTNVAASETVVDIEVAWKEMGLRCMLPHDHPVRADLHDTFGIVLPRPGERESVHLRDGDRVVVPELVFTEFGSLTVPTLKCVEWHPKDRPVEFPARDQDLE